MKSSILIALPMALAAILGLTACTSPRFYSPILGKPSDSPDKYTPIRSNGIEIPASPETGDTFWWELSLDRVYPGFLHRAKERSYNSKTQKAMTYRHKNLWVLLEAEGLGNGDLLETKVDRKAAFSHVVVNAASYNSVTVNVTPIPLTDRKTYRIKVKIYAIDAFLLKKAIGASQDRSLGKWVKDTVLGLGDTVSQAFAKEAFDYYKIATDQNYDLETFLLISGGTLEFSGGFDVVVNEGGPTAEFYELALFDRIKSSVDRDYDGKVDPNRTAVEPGKISNPHLDIPLRPKNEEEYEAGFKQLMGTFTIPHDEASWFTDVGVTLKISKKKYATAPPTFK